MDKLPKDIKTGSPVIYNSTLIEENPNYKIMDKLKINKRNKKVKAFINKYNKNK